MKRRIFNLLAALSLLLCIATVALWVASYWREVGMVRRLRDPADGGRRFDWFVVARGRIDCTASFQANPWGWDDTLPRWQLCHDPLENSNDDDVYFYFRHQDDGVSIAAPGFKWVNGSFPWELVSHPLRPLLLPGPGVRGVAGKVGLDDLSRSRTRPPWPLLAMRLRPPRHADRCPECGATFLQLCNDRRQSRGLVAPLVQNHGGRINNLSLSRPRDPLQDLPTNGLLRQCLWPNRA